MQLTSVATVTERRDAAEIFSFDLLDSIGMWVRDVIKFTGNPKDMKIIEGGLFCSKE